MTMCCISMAGDARVAGNPEDVVPEILGVEGEGRMAKATARQLMGVKAIPWAATLAEDVSPTEPVRGTVGGKR